MMTVNGTLRVGAQTGNDVVFTSLTDDSVGGDTNNDGSATSPAPGDRRGLVLENGADASTLDHTTIRFAGAIERAAYTMTVGGVPRIDTTMAFTTDRPPGLALYLLGFVDGAFFFPPMGWINAGSPGLLFLMGAVPTGQPLLFPLALDPVLEGLTFALQAIALPNVNPSQASNATNVWRGALFP